MPLELRNGHDRVLKRVLGVDVAVRDQLVVDLRQIPHEWRMNGLPWEWAISVICL